MTSKLNREAFFREAILRITGNLEIEKALYECYVYFKDFLPLDHLMLMHPDYDTNRMKVLATANDQGGVIDHRCWEVPPDLMARMRSNQLPSIMVIKDPEAHFVSRHAAILGLKDSSMLVVRLFISDQLVGSLIFRVAGYNQYDDQHADLLAPLREPFAVALSNSLRYRQLLELKESLSDDNRYLQEELRRSAGEAIIGADFGLKGVMDLVRQVSPLDSPVLLLGATGTGKELIASAIHAYSRRSQGPMVKMNCGAITPSLIDTELFGHEKGAFTGAVATKKGRFERAHQGTLFLDEIGELPADAQVRLLRVLQEHEIERVGASAPIKVDVRVIAATHRNLEKMVAAGRFREDLFFRLLVFPITLPPLVERKGDIPALTQYFMQKKARQMGIGFTPTVSPEGLQALMAYHWPGNVRELENAVERELIINRGNPLNFDRLVAGRPNWTPERKMDHGDTVWPLAGVIKNHIRKALAATHGQIGGKGGAAELMGIHPSTLRSRMRKMGIPFKSKNFRGPQ